MGQHHFKINNVIKGTLNTSYGSFSLYCFSMTNEFDNHREQSEHLALVKGEEKGWKGQVYYRLNSACLTSEVFNCERCDCKWQLDKAMEVIAKEGRGIITYHSNHEGRGFGLAAKLLSYEMMDTGVSSSDSYIMMGLGTEDRRDYRAAIEILNYFNVEEVLLLGNNKKKLQALEYSGVRVSGRYSLIYDGEKYAIHHYLNKKAVDPEQDLLRINLELAENGAVL
ncbi:hypothetical protein [Paenibacillus glucanolyticus]|uniref:hypothetical protein n=1 Tax=Paenibacillus glucanolyticus TaxID=59843 RepID=UPI0034CEC220